MKYWIVGIVIAVLGFGEYVFVNVAPYPPEKRMEQFVSLPFVKPIAMPIAEAWAMHRMEGWVDDGYPHAYRALYTQGRLRGDEAMKQRALKLLRASNTAYAAVYLFVIDNEGAAPDFSGEEFAILQLRAAIENLRSPWADDEYYERASNARTDYIKQVYDKAESGDERSQRIVGALEESTGEAAPPNLREKDLTPLSEEEIDTRNIKLLEKWFRGQKRSFHYGDEHRMYQNADELYAQFRDGDAYAELFVHGRLIRR